MHWKNSSTTTVTSCQNVRFKQSLKDGWRFKRADGQDMQNPNADDSDWQQVRVPHDWAINEPFDRANDLQYTQVKWDGQTHAHEHNGRTGGLPHVGVGWYRLSLNIPEDLQDKVIWLEFDGIMSHSQIYINGKFVGGRPYGYTSFKVDITKYVVCGENNLLAVRAENKPQSSRWYPGAGIYRHVRLVAVNPLHVAHWGTFIHTQDMDAQHTRVTIQTQLENTAKAVSLTLTSVIWDPDGLIVDQIDSQIDCHKQTTVKQTFILEKPIRWEINNPRRYTVDTFVTCDEVVVDEYQTRFGIRSIVFTPDKGMFLNGKACRLKGVCLHHDLGPLGAAVNRSAIKRQLVIMKQMGANAIRCTHNPAAPELMELCDELGLLVIAEAFDEWEIAKCENGYAKFFSDWAQRDLSDLIRRDRNHPSVILWSIGNEILEQHDPQGAQITKKLVEICHKTDPTRKTTAGFSRPDLALKHGLAQAVDVPGWNYKPHLYREIHNQYPNMICYGSETMSTVSSRGIYHFPVIEERHEQDPTIHENLQLSSYDLACPLWATTMEVEFEAQKEHPFIAGQFVWTGFDYLGEPSPYNQQWPARSSYFGIVDLCGLPKDRYEMFRLQWTDQQVLHILPHWTWPGREGQLIPVHIYTRYESVELYLNGRSLGKRSLQPQSYNLLNRYRLIWDNVTYEPGQLKAVAYQNNKIVCEKTVSTAGQPAAIQLISNVQTIHADGDDMVFVTAVIVDAQGNVCPHADNTIRFTTQGPMRILTVGNGDPTSVESYGQPQRKAFNGKCVAYLRSLPDQVGDAQLKAQTNHLKSASITIEICAIPTG